jgi:DNA invertase Pin-like site-specific DNA recombinase
MSKRLTPVDAYIRVSRVSGREGDSFISPDLQRESIGRVCAREGLKVVLWHEELDASGGDATRPLWNDAISRVEEGLTKGIVVWNLSRFSRSVKDALTALERVEAVGGKLYSEEGQLDKLSRVIRLAIAEDERDRARAGFRNAAANALDRGVYIAAKIPFGYTSDPETRRLVPDERAHIVAELFERRAKGQSWRQLSKWVTETHGIYLAKTTLSTMLANPAYLGVARQGDLINPKAHESIVSRLLFDQAKAAKGSRPVHSGMSQNLLLRGIVTCGSCGHKMVVGNSRSATDPATGKRAKVPGYYCRNGACDAHAYVRADELDREVIDRLMTYLRRGSPAKVKTRTNNAPALTRAEKELEEAQYALDTFKSNKRAITTLGVDAWNELLEEYVLARDMAKSELETLQADRSLEERTELPTLWDEWTNESRREFLQKMILDCYVVPAHRRRIPIGERLALRLSGSSHRWLLSDGHWTKEPFGDESDTSKIGFMVGGATKAKLRTRGI